jgi:hypothetical protein
MNFFGRNLHGPAKMIVIFAAILLASGGLCGLQIAIVSQSHEQYGGNLGGVFFLTGIIELAAMVVSLVGIVIVLILWAIRALTRSKPDDSSGNL